MKKIEKNKKANCQKKPFIKMLKRNNKVNAYNKEKFFYLTVKNLYL